MRQPPDRPAAGLLGHAPFVALTVAAAIVLTAPVAASAHVRSGVIAVSYRATVDPLPPAVSAQVDQSDRALRLTVAAGHVVVVLGYLGEPVARIDANGVAVNEASPTAAGSGLAGRKGRPPLAGIAWRTRSTRRSVTWHDARLRGLPPGARRARWSVPVVLDGRRIELTGQLTRVPPPAWWPWLLLLSPFVAAAAIVLQRGGRTRERGALVLGGLAGVATLTAALGFSLDRYASAGTWVESADEALLVVASGLVLRYVRDRPLTRSGAVAVLGALGVFLGLTKAAAFNNGVVLSVLPATATRVAVGVAFAAGAAAITVAATSLFGVDLASVSAEDRRHDDDFWAR